MWWLDEEKRASTGTVSTEIGLCLILIGRNHLSTWFCMYCMHACEFGETRMDDSLT